MKGTTPDGRTREMPMFDITAIGEVLIDFTPEGTAGNGVLLLQRNPGGAPANALAMASRWGCETAFIGKAGADVFGVFLRDVLEENAIDVSGLVLDPAYPTTLAFVHIDPKGERSFTFYRNPGADIMLAPGEVDSGLIERGRILHFGAVCLSGGPSREATLEAARLAATTGKTVSFDVNYRPPLWENEVEARSVILRALSLAHVLKVSLEEAELLTGTADYREAARALAASGPLAVLVTMGERGAYFQTPAGDGHCPAYAVPVTDTTGAGDAFTGTILARLAGCLRQGRNISSITRREWEDMVDEACCAGSLATTCKGGINAMPDPATVARLRKEGRRIP